MPTITIPSIRDNTTIARVAAMDSGGSTTKRDTGEVVVTAPGRLLLSRRGIESALGYPLRHSVWRALKDAVADGAIAVADDMTLLVEREDQTRRDTPPLGASDTIPQGGYTTQRYRAKREVATVEET